MILLGIDTSTSTGGAALVDQDNLLAEYVLNIYNGHSERILPTIKRILNDTDITVNDVSAFAVVSGPGSFTGLRVGLATIKGFAYTLDKPIVPVTNMQALAWQYQNYPFLLCTLIDARRKEVFTQLFRGNNPVSEPINCKVENLIAKLKKFDEPILFVGEGAIEYRHQLSQLEQANFPGIDGVRLRPGSVAGLGLNLFSQHKSKQWHEVMPFYMRKSSAEYQLDLMETKNGVR